MKPEIHPEYREVLFHDTSADAYFLIGSTISTQETRDYEGKTYPYVSIDISSASHPFYTGKQKSAQSDGRVAKFNKRYGRQAKSWQLVGALILQLGTAAPFKKISATFSGTHTSSLTIGNSWNDSEKCPEVLSETSAEWSFADLTTHKTVNRASSSAN